TRAVGLHPMRHPVEGHNGTPVSASAHVRKVPTGWLSEHGGTAAYPTYPAGTGNLRTCLLPATEANGRRDIDIRSRHRKSDERQLIYRYIGKTDAGALFPAGYRA